MEHLERLRAYVAGRLSEKRCHHCLMVQRQSIRLARVHGADWFKAGIAGLLHDVCREMEPGEQLKYLQAHGILLDSSTRANPDIWHAVTGAVYARETLGIRDEDVLSAIRCHTSGRAGMSLLDKVVYLADCVSEDRTYADVERVRALAEEDLDSAVREKLLFTVREVASRGVPLVGDTWEAYNEYMLREDECRK